MSPQCQIRSFNIYPRLVMDEIYGINFNLSKTNFNFIYLILIIYTYLIN